MSDVEAQLLPFYLFAWLMIKYTQTQITTHSELAGWLSVFRQRISQLLVGFLNHKR